MSSRKVGKKSKKASKTTATSRKKSGNQPATTSKKLDANISLLIPTPKKTCFVIMPIGDLEIGDTKISASELRSKYTDLIKEAIVTARNDIEVIRADEVVRGGGITNDIFDRVMRSDYVVADLTYPNPNVYYELGLRHACRPGTISIREKDSPFRTPFDVSNSRHIEYQNTATGIKSLRTALEQGFAWIDANTSTPDNMFLEYAQFVKFEFPRYGRDTNSDVADAFAEILQYPELLEALSSGNKLDQKSMMALMAKYPAVAKTIIKLMLGTGKLKLPF